jgi:glycosyltransferase involved in cell wall biosynthesis
MIPSYFSNNSIINKIKVLYLDLIVKMSCRRCCGIFSDSESTKNDLNNCLGVKSIVIKPGKNKWPNNIENSLINFEKDSFYFYIGNNRKQKNLDFLINAFQKSNSIKKLVLAGFQVSSTCERIKYLGKVSENDLAFLYRNSYAFVFPSLYEGFGLPILEAMDFNCRIISSNAGSLAEFSQASINYFNPYDEARLIDFFNNETKIKFDPKSYKIYTDNLTWDNYFKQMSKLVFND